MNYHKCFRSYFSFVAVLALAVLASCNSVPGDLVGEKIHINMLTFPQMTRYTAKGKPSRAFLDALKPWDADTSAAQQFSNNWDDISDTWLEAHVTEESSPVLAVLAPVVVGAIIDVAASSLRERAGEYEAAWSMSTVFDGYWQEAEITEAIQNKLKAQGLTDEALGRTGWLQKYMGIEVVRETAQTPLAEGGASRMVFLILPSKANRQLFLLHPFFYANRASRAKTNASKAVVDVEVALQLHGTWVGKDDKAVQHTFATASLDIGGYRMPREDGAEARFWTDPSTQAAGWFAAGPAGELRTPCKSDGEQSGVFRVTVAVHEADASRSKDVIERAAKLIEDNRDHAIKYSTGG